MNLEEHLMRSFLIYILLLGGTITLASTQEQVFDSPDIDSVKIIGVLESLDSLATSDNNDFPDKLSFDVFDYITSFEEHEEADYIIVFDSSHERSGEKEIMSVVKTFYSLPENRATPEDVLGFLANAYSEHDFHESGVWTEQKKTFRSYVPYKGELPAFTIKDFREPITGHLTSGYGYRPQRGSYHQGIDISANRGDSVRSALPGVVTKIGFERKGYGHYVVVSHSGDIETIYAHLSQPVASPGQKVNAGDIIGLAGSTGNSTGTHLHFETRFRGLPVNPFSWFDLRNIKP